MVCLAKSLRSEDPVRPASYSNFIGPLDHKRRLAARWCCRTCVGLPKGELDLRAERIRLPNEKRNRNVCTEFRAANQARRRPASEPRKRAPRCHRPYIAFVPILSSLQKGRAGLRRLRGAMFGAWMRLPDG